MSKRKDRERFEREHTCFRNGQYVPVEELEAVKARRAARAVISRAELHDTLGFMNKIMRKDAEMLGAISSLAMHRVSNINTLPPDDEKNMWVYRLVNILDRRIQDKIKNAKFEWRP